MTISFDDFEHSIIARTVGFGKPGSHAGYRSVCRESRDYAKVTPILAAAAIVIRDKGAQWCLSDESRFLQEIVRSLNFWLGLGIVIATIATGGVVWIAIAKFVLPYILEFLREQMASGCFGIGAEPNEVFGEGAENALRGYSLQYGTA
ncbi:MAG: hypothetical protein ACKO0Z_18240 [Betaproteobacteria bacterium]